MRWQCPECSRQMVLPSHAFRVFCPCGYRGQFKAAPPPPPIDPEKEARRKKLLQQAAMPKESHWPKLHQYAIDRWDTWSTTDAQAFYTQWRSEIPRYACDCEQRWAKYEREHSPDFSSARAWFVYSVEAHNFVSAEHVKPPKPRISLAQAYGIYRRSGRLSTKVPAGRPLVDVIVPFCEADKQYLIECLDAIYKSERVMPIVHCVADGCEFPQTEYPIRRYQTAGGLGPYRIANSLVRDAHIVSEIVAIQDVDDLMLSNRLWQQLASMQEWGYQMVGGAMQQEPMENYRGQAHIVEPVLYSWRTYRTAPKGHLVNGTRMIEAELLRQVNGFADWPCSADVDLCNRISHLPWYESIPVLGSDEIVAVRRLHGASLTNGPAYCIGSDARKDMAELVDANIEAMQQSPSLETARSMGGMDKAPELVPF